ncbi:hypothetical protein V1478_013235 [Vespula squamosa]|uniref:Uncharacterized protein n=1 Tax=Vespula squamosa TaxID=30214 RepID=A0ABD2ACG1_VESSQ
MIVRCRSVPISSNVLCRLNGTTRRREGKNKSRVSVASKRIKKRNVVGANDDDDGDDDGDDDDDNDDDNDDDYDYDEVVLCAFVVILLTHFRCDARCAATKATDPREGSGGGEGGREGEGGGGGKGGVHVREREKKEEVEKIEGRKEEEITTASTIFDLGPSQRFVI